MRVAVLLTGLSGYMNACLQELGDRPGVELFVAHSETDSQAPFEASLFSWMKQELVWRDESDLPKLQSQLTAFRPEVVLVAGWHVPMYRRIMKPLKGRCLRIMTMDNCWLGTLKQRVGSLLSRFYVLPMADAVWVPGQRQAMFARRLKFPVRRILHGLLSCDYAEFAAVYQRRIAAGRTMPKAFLYVGRFSAEKGVATLADAYARYHATTSNPWPLLVCGAGPLQPLLEGKRGIELQGFVQPGNLPLKLEMAACLVVPSSRDAWALVIHEAAAAGLLIVSTENVGAVPHLVHNYYNGFVVNAGDPIGLAEVMTQVSKMDLMRQERMSRASHELSCQYTPARWADTLLDFSRDCRVGQQ